MSVDRLADQINRRQFLGRASATGAGVLVGAGTLDALVPSFAAAK
jgi:hypothetical protein